jgi:hypothetical protein
MKTRVHVFRYKIDEFTRGAKGRTAHHVITEAHNVGKIYTNIGRREAARAARRLTQRKRTQ